MSNQRPGKFKPATMRDGGGSMNQLHFFKECARELHDAKEDEAAFYFEQIVDHIRQGGSLHPNEVDRALGL